MAFEFKKCDIEGSFEIQPKIFGDNRGYFLETYSEKDFFEAGLTMKFVQDNQSKSTMNVLRGLHFQKNYPQCKLVRAVRGSVFDVAVDLRSDSKTYGKWYGVELTKCCRTAGNELIIRFNGKKTAKFFKDILIEN